MSDRKPIFKHAQIVKMQRLLNMLYRPAELAEEIEVTSDTVYRSYIPAGAPHERDAKGNIWIHGLTFRAWAEEIIKAKKQKRNPMPEGKAWCLKCKQAVTMKNPTIKPVKRYLEIIQATCPHCGSTINRARARDKSKPQATRLEEPKAGRRSSRMVSK